MKRSILLFLLMSSATMSFAQSPSYVDFEWDVLRFGYVIPVSSDQATGGATFGGELRYNATDRFSIGIGGAFTAFGSNFDEQEFGISGSSLLYGDYYFADDSATRPFAGLGLGLFSSGTITTDVNGVEEVIDGGTGFGFAPRIGYEFGHIRLQGQYNITFGEGQSDYFGVTVALTLWGGYKGEG